MANALAVTLRANAATTVSGTADAVDIGAARTALALLLSVTAIEAGGTLAVYVEASADGVTGWRHVGNFEGARSAVEDERSFDQAARYVRIRWVLTGASATFSVVGAAHQLYVQRRHLFRRISEEQLTSAVQPHQIADALISASGDIEDALGTAYGMPLAQGSESAARRGAAIALYLLMDGIVGFKPEGLDALIPKGYDDAQHWLKDVSAGRIQPPEFQAAPNLGPKVSSGNPAAPDPVARFTDDWGDF